MVAQAFKSDQGLVLRTIEPDAFYGFLMERGRLLAPVLDWASNRLPRTDYAATSCATGAFQEAVLHIQPIINRWKALWLYGREHEADRESLAIALAHTRATGLHARLDPASRDFVHYPLLSGLGEVQPLLDGMHGRGLFESSTV